MATITEIKTLRLEIADPAGIINIETVALPADLPATPEQQTAYYVESTKYYMITDLISGALPGNYRPAVLRISDDYIFALIDTYGIDQAICRAYRWIIARLGNELILVKNSTGAESAEYAKVNDMLKYYRQLYKDCFDQYNKSQLNSTGRFYRSEQPTIAGGNL